VPIFSPDHQVGKALINNTNVEQDTTIKEGWTDTQTNSIEASYTAEFKMFEVLKN